MEARSTVIVSEHGVRSGSVSVAARSQALWVLPVARRTSAASVILQLQEPIEGLVTVEAIRMVRPVPEPGGLSGGHPVRPGRV